MALKDWERDGYSYWTHKRDNKIIEIARFTKSDKNLPTGWYGIALYYEHKFRALNMTKTRAQALNFAKAYMRTH